MRKKFLGFGAMILLTPLGIMLPHWFNSGSAWGEWSNDEVAHLSGKIPLGMGPLASLWKAPLSGYNLTGVGKASLLHQNLATVLSAFLGVAVLLSLGWGMGWLLGKRDSK